MKDFCSKNIWPSNTYMEINTMMLNINLTSSLDSEALVTTRSNYWLPQSTEFLGFLLLDATPVLTRHVGLPKNKRTQFMIAVPLNAKKISKKDASTIRQTRKHVTPMVENLHQWLSLNLELLHVINSTMQLMYSASVTLKFPVCKLSFARISTTETV